MLNITNFIYVPKYCSHCYQISESLCIFFTQPYLISWVVFQTYEKTKKRLSCRAWGKEIRLKENIRQIKIIHSSILSIKIMQILWMQGEKKKRRKQESVAAAQFKYMQ